jgi:hypothetical protein
LLYSDRVQVHITAQFQQIAVFLNQDCLVSALIEVTTSFVATIVGDGVGGVESLHEPTEVCLGGGENKVKMIFHEHIGMYLYGIEGTGC